MPLTINPTVLRGDQVEARDQGYLTWTHDPMLGVGGLLLSTGLQYLLRVMIPRPMVLTTVSFYVNTIGATLTSGANNLAVYDATGTRIAATADLSASSYLSTGLKAVAFTAPVTVSGGPGQFVWIGVKSTGTTPVTLLRAAVPFAQAAVNAGLTTANYRSATNGSVTNALMPATITVGSNSPGATTLWLALS